MRINGGISILFLLPSLWINTKIYGGVYNILISFFTTIQK